VHQCRRLNSPLLLVTTHKGQEFPRLTPADTAGDAATSAGGISTKSSKRKEGYFDRVLCDVPCSGNSLLNILVFLGVYDIVILDPICCVR